MTFSAFAQPFTLDENIKPVELLLQEDTRSDHKGEKFIATLSTVDSTKQYVIKGHDMFQFVDVIVKGFGNESALKASLVYDNWGDVIESQTSTSAEDGIIQFQVRAYGAFGLLIESPSEETINEVFSKATSLEVAAQEGDFAEAAAAQELEVRPVNRIGKMDSNIPGVGNNRTIINWAFEEATSVGDVKRFNVLDGYVIARLTRRNAEKGLMSVAEASATVTPILRKKKKAEMSRRQHELGAKHGVWYVKGSPELSK